MKIILWKIKRWYDQATKQYNDHLQEVQKENAEDNPEWNDYVTCVYELPKSGRGQKAILEEIDKRIDEILAEEETQTKKQTGKRT